MYKLVLIVFLFISNLMLAQDSINQTDAQGKKQGVWIKKDPQGNLIYQATFKDDKPVGEMKRYHENGKIKAIMVFTEGSEVSDAQLFDEQGKLVAQGKYEGQKKTGEWQYLLNSKIVSTETYLNGQKHGLSKRYYKTGEILEEATWQNDKLHGVYRSYFQDGKPYIECNYTEGKRQGVFKTSFANGEQELDAFYTNDARDKDWSYYDQTGRLLYTLKFDSGKLLNPEVQDSIEKSNENFFNKADNIPDPEKFMQNPEEYMQLMNLK